MPHAVEVVQAVTGGLAGRRVRTVVDAVCARLRLRRAQGICVSFVGDATMRALNRRTRGKDRTTDVLAFPAADKRAPAFPAPRGEPTPLGDVVISVPEAKRQARERQLPVDTVEVELLIHGLLHCAGYDHERPQDARRMFPLQAGLLAALVRPRS